MSIFGNKKYKLTRDEMLVLQHILGIWVGM